MTDTPRFWCAVCGYWVEWSEGCHDETEEAVAATYALVTGDIATDAGCCDDCWREIDALEAAA